VTRPGILRGSAAVDEQAEPKGTPFREARARARYLLEDATPEVMRDALYTLIGTRPNELLGALANALDIDA
jgi:hypothetical protein